jgi:Carboxypeptidase regulatory-like domain
VLLPRAQIVALVCCLASFALPASAQQTGSISGKAADTGGGLLPGVTVEASSDVLPSPRATTTGGQGEFLLPALPPGNYTVTFTLSGMQTVTRKALVQLSQDTVVNAELGLQGVSESVTVTASASVIDKESASIKSGLSSEQISGLPVAQEYRDLIRLIPAVQYTQDQTRGPSAGGSGQDNVYQFDGVNVTLPLFGTLSAEPASHDVAQITVIKGGARAVDFDRSGGFSIDSVSKSGTSRYSGQASYQFQTETMAADLTSGALSRYRADRSWLDANVGGPILSERLFFYGSYYRPENTRDNRANLYGDLPKYESTRDEGFGKLTFTPTRSILINGSYRNSKRVETSRDDFATNAAPTTGAGAENRQKIGIIEGSWVVNNRSYVTGKFTDFTLLSEGRPDHIANATVNTAVGTRIDIANLDTLGLLTVPQPVAGQTAFNDFIAPIVSRYGYLSNGVRTGGGTVGYSTLFDNDDFFRKAGQIGYNLIFGGTMRHTIHAGYQRYVDSEDLERSSNGWGSITVPGGRLSFQGTPYYYAAAFQQQTTGLIPAIHSEYRSQSFELNDTIALDRWTFNLGLLASNDTLYGQGLKNDSSTVSGFILACPTCAAPPGTKYKMYEIPFSEMIQPRLGATWSYNGKDTVYASYATYNPAASSLPRAASWDRNVAVTINAYFDQNGILLGTDPLASSSGKLFVPDLTPRTIYETLVGTSKQFNARWSGRLYGRYRSAKHFWEDTNNTARLSSAQGGFNPPDGIPRQLYIPNLDQQRAQIGSALGPNVLSGSSYVIAELDGAFTKYYEGTLETEWKNDKAFVRGSYTWSHYYGNFDQDSSGVTNDANVFIGSSNIADGAGRQLWNNRYGDLRGDRRHLLKIYGYHALPWNATAGLYAVAQSGQPWEAWSYEPYIALTTNTSDTARFAEPAGTRHTPPHWQVDLNYTQNVRVGGRYNFQIVGDLFNVANHQPGYNFQPAFHNSAFNTPRNYFDPRRFQVALRFQF